MKVTKHVYFYQGLQGGAISWSNSTLICGKKQILIDPGCNIQSHLEDLILAIAEDEKDIAQTNEIWLTHSHPDHAELAGVLSKQYKIEATRCHFKIAEVIKDPEPVKKFFIYVNSEVIRGKKIVKTPFFWRKVGLKVLFFFPWLYFRRFCFWIAGKIMERFFGEWLPAPNVEVFTREEVIDNNPDIQILFLPGHAPEEIGFWIEKEKILIIGDLINISLNRQAVPCLVSPQSNFEDALNSLKRIKELPIKILIPAHGFFLKDEELIKSMMTKMIVRMERHRQQVKEILEKNPKTNIEQLSRMVLNDLPLSVSQIERKQYLASILDSLGYYKNGANNKNNKKS